MATDASPWTACYPLHWLTGHAYLHNFCRLMSVDLWLPSAGQFGPGDQYLGCGSGGRRGGRPVASRGPTGTSCLHI